MALSPGTQLGIYEVLSPLGAGGMGEVYRARDTRLRREVAVKVLPSALSGDPEWRTRFTREAQVLASLNHPSIATIHGLEESADGARFLILELVDGETLAGKLVHGPFSLQDSFRTCAQIAIALEAAHAKGVVHRDLKPGNVMITPSGAIKLLDFGLASSAGAGVGGDGTSRMASIGATGTGAPDASTVMGTPGYMSPEQVRGEEQDRRTDVFSFGCVLYECLSGRRAFSGKTAPEAMGAVLYATPDLGALPGGTPAGIKTLLERCLEKEPAKRLRDIGDARLELETAAASSGRQAPAPAGPAQVHNVPKPRTSFVGREKEVAECSRWLTEHRVLTLTGVGGSGKTRLAIRVAESRIDQHKDGVWFVDLAPIQDEERVLIAVATALGVKEEPGGTLLDSLTVHLAEKEALLVLDNCEHVLAAVFELTEPLLESCASLRLLATSREGLGLEGERLYAVRSLGVPPREAWSDAQAVESSDAVQLFLDRAKAVEPRFALDARNGRLIAEICRRLDGIPLAIELAAARVKVLSIEQIRAKLDDRFRLLTGGSKTALPRHQTLRATVQWSYDQLMPEEQAMLRRLSVFAGGWTLEGATAVAGEQADEFEVLDRLTRLVDKSLVVVEREGGGEPRYRMLETVRQYAEEQLSGSGEGPDARTRHLDFYIAFGEVGDEKLVGPEQGEWLLQYDLEFENLVSALGWCRQSPDSAVKEAMLAAGIRFYWDSRGLYELGSRITREALERGGAELPSEVQRKLLTTMVSILVRRGLAEEAIRYSERAIELAEQQGDSADRGGGLRMKGVALTLLGEMTEARACLEQAIELLRPTGNKMRLSNALGALGEILRSVGQNDAALPVYVEALQLAREAGDLDSVAIQLVNLAMIAIDSGDAAQARDHLREGFSIAERIGGKYVGATAITSAGALAALVGNPARAARLWGASAAARDRMGVTIDPPDAQFVNRHMPGARSAMGAEAFAAAERAGREVLYEAAFREAKAWLEEKA